MPFVPDKRNHEAKPIVEKLEYAVGNYGIKTQLTPLAKHLSQAKLVSNVEL